MRWPLVWRSTLDASQAECNTLRDVALEHAALIGRMQEKLSGLQEQLREAETRTVVPAPVKRASDQAIRERLVERGLQGEALDRAVREISGKGLQTLGRLG